MRGSRRIPQVMMLLHARDGDAKGPERYAGSATACRVLSLSCARLGGFGRNHVSRGITYTNFCAI